jgi:single-strand DNA-binding protein
MNKTIIIGNITHTPETRTTQSGKSVCSFDVAVNKKRAGEITTEFFRVSAWNKLGEICQQFAAKGKKICVEGEITARAYMGKDGEPRYSLEITAQDVEFLSPRSEEREPVSTAMPSYAQEQLDHAKQTAVGGEWQTITDSDLPF